MIHVAPLLICAVAGFVLSGLVTGIALMYARRRGLIDLPGKRRSHVSPTPRGGGVGIVAAALLIGIPALLWLPGAWPASTVAHLAVAVFAVAVIGWLDDHRPMPIWPRILVHVFAAFLVGGAFLMPFVHADGWTLWWLPVIVIVLIGFINAHNFMDGIDGILGQQGLFVMLGYGLLAETAAYPGLAALAFATAAGCLGFLIFNSPPARIFMGDVGSGALGLLIGAVAALLVQRDPAMLWPCLILSSAFLVDSGLTLARRILGGQRWYTPHRQHLYQWLVRVKWSHARTDAAYLTWNLAIAAPLAWLAARWLGSGPWCCLAAYAAAIVVWHVGKRSCLASVRRRAIREPA